MTNHPHRHPGAPMRRESYLKLCRELRESADRIEALVGSGVPQEPQGKRVLTINMRSIRAAVERAHRRHSATIR